MPEQTVTVQQAFETMLSSYYKLKEAMDSSGGALEKAIEDEKAERESADSLLSERLERETVEREWADTEEREERIAAINTERSERQVADDAFTDAIIEIEESIETETAERKGADADLSDRIDQTAAEIADIKDNYAPLESPHFTGQPTVPDPLESAPLNMGQAVNLGNWIGLHNLTMETSGSFIRKVDTNAETGASATVEMIYTRKLDVDNSVTAYEFIRETDHEKTASEHELTILRDIVMSTSGGKLRCADLSDSSSLSVTNALRVIDRAYGVVEYRTLDSMESTNGSATWVDA